jgi:hypothetical protein
MEESVLQVSVGRHDRQLYNCTFWAKQSTSCHRITRKDAVSLRTSEMLADCHRSAGLQRHNTRARSPLISAIHLTIRYSSSSRDASCRVPAHCSRARAVYRATEKLGGTLCPTTAQPLWRRQPHLALVAINFRRASAALHLTRAPAQIQRVRA